MSSNNNNNKTSAKINKRALEDWNHQGRKARKEWESSWQEGSTSVSATQHQYQKGNFAQRFAKCLTDQPTWCLLRYLGQHSKSRQCPTVLKWVHQKPEGQQSPQIWSQGNKYTGSRPSRPLQPGLCHFYWIGRRDDLMEALRRCEQNTTAICQH